MYHRWNCRYHTYSTAYDMHASCAACFAKQPWNETPSQSSKIPCSVSAHLLCACWLYYKLSYLRRPFCYWVTTAHVFWIGTTALAVSQTVATTTPMGTEATRDSMVGGAVTTKGPRISPQSLLSLCLWETCLHRPSKETWMLFSRTWVWVGTWALLWGGCFTRCS